MPTHGSRAMVGVASLSCWLQALGTLVSAAAARAIVSLCVEGGTLVNGAVDRAGGGVDGGRKRKMLVIVLGALEEQRTLASGAALGFDHLDGRRSWGGSTGLGVAVASLWVLVGAGAGAAARTSLLLPTHGREGVGPWWGLFLCDQSWCWRQRRLHPGASGSALAAGSSRCGHPWKCISFVLSTSWWSGGSGCHGRVLGSIAALLGVSRWALVRALGVETSRCEGISVVPFCRGMGAGLCTMVGSWFI